MTMTITLLQDLSEPELEGFKYLWMKNVHGFKSSQHCAQCLEGTYWKGMNSHFPAHKPKIIPALEEGHVYYLCGVSTPYVHANNFHLAFTEGNWEVEMPLWTGASFLLTGIQPIFFDDKKARELYPNKSEAFLTCRNFQFGVHHFVKSL